MTGLKKLNLKTIGTMLAGLLFLLLFFSKTIYNYNLPVVTAAAPQNGKLNKLEISSGIAQWANVTEVYAQFGGKIEEVMVREGDQVEGGQALIRMSFEIADLEQKLKELAISREKLLIEIEKLNRELEKVSRTLDEAESGLNASSSNELVQAQQDYARLKVLYEAGAVSQQEADNAAAKLEKLSDQYTENQVSLKQNLRIKTLDLASLSLQETTYKKTLADYQEHSVIYAPDNASVTELAVNQGQYVSPHQFMLSLGTGNAYEIICDISLNNNFVTIGDSCKITNASHSLTGTVINVTPEQNCKKVAIAVQSDAIAKGETFDLRFEKSNAVSAVLVPNGAVNKDSDGYFLYQIKRRDGMLGKEYYAEKLRVYIGDSDADYTVISQGVTFFEPVVLLSDKPFTENEAIKIKNEGDFFDF